jgi:hypothetical protein
MALVAENFQAGLNDVLMISQRFGVCVAHPGGGTTWPQLRAAVFAQDVRANRCCEFPLNDSS